MRKKLIIYTDGGARGNPGPAAIGIVITDEADNVVYEFSGTIGHATNNVAEYRALIHGLEQAARLQADEAEVRLDSELLQRQMNGEYRVRNRNLIPLAVRARQLMNSFHRCRITRIPRRENARADKLVNQALNETAS